MHDRPNPRRVIAMAMFASAFVMLVLAALTFSGILPFRESIRVVLGAVFAVVAASEAIIAVVFLRSHDG